MRLSVALNSLFLFSPPKGMNKCLLRIHNKHRGCNKTLAQPPPHQHKLVKLATKQTL